VPIWSCTECGCEAVAASVDMVVSMGWLVEPPAVGEDMIAALCAKCRLHKKGPVRSASARGPERSADFAGRPPRTTTGTSNTST